MPRKVEDLSPDFWPAIESIVDQADQSWEIADSGMKWCEVQVDKSDIEMFRAALCRPSPTT